MALDDANDNPGAPGECPGHEWVPAQILLKPRGAELTVRCRWCGAIQVEPSKNEDFYRDTALEDEALELAYAEVLKRLEAQGAPPAGGVREVRKVIPLDGPSTE